MLPPMQNPSPYRLTKHMAARMSQRGIPRELVDLVYHYGREDDDRVVLDSRALRSLLDAARHLQRTVLKALDKGGVVVVESRGSLLTTYNLDQLGHGGRHG